MEPPVHPFIAEMQHLLIEGQYDSFRVPGATTPNGDHFSAVLVFRIRKKKQFEVLLIPHREHRDTHTDSETETIRETAQRAVREKAGILIASHVLQYIGHRIAPEDAHQKIAYSVYEKECRYDKRFSVSTGNSGMPVWVALEHVFSLLWTGHHWIVACLIHALLHSPKMKEEYPMITTFLRPFSMYAEKEIARLSDLHIP